MKIEIADWNVKRNKTETKFKKHTFLGINQSRSPSWWQWNPTPLHYGEAAAQLYSSESRNLIKIVWFWNRLDWTDHSDIKSKTYWHAVNFLCLYETVRQTSANSAGL